MGHLLAVVAYIYSNDRIGKQDDELWGHFPHISLRHHNVLRGNGAVFMLFVRYIIFIFLHQVRNLGLLNAMNGRAQIGKNKHADPLMLQKKVFSLGL